MSGYRRRAKEEPMEQYIFVRLHAREGEEGAVEEALLVVAGRVEMGRSTALWDMMVAFRPALQLTSG